MEAEGKGIPSQGGGQRVERVQPERTPLVMQGVGAGDGRAGQFGQSVPADPYEVGPRQATGAIKEAAELCKGALLRPEIGVSGPQKHGRSIPRADPRRAQQAKQADQGKALLPPKPGQDDGAQAGERQSPGEAAEQRAFPQVCGHGQGDRKAACQDRAH